MADKVPKSKGEMPKYSEVQDIAGWSSDISNLDWKPSPFNGIYLRVKCPTCKHDDGINIFVPTSWDQGGDVPSPNPAPAVGNMNHIEDFSGHFDIAAALVTESPPQLEVAHPAAVKEFDSDVMVGLTEESDLSLLLEVAVCRCGVVHEDTPKGKTGCGRWGYIPVPDKDHMPNKAKSDDQRT
jgi:hypothetical protein